MTDLPKGTRPNEIFQKYNSHHDQRGRFSTVGSGLGRPETVPGRVVTTGGSSASSKPWSGALPHGTMITSKTPLHLSSGAQVKRLVVVGHKQDGSKKTYVGSVKHNGKTETFEVKEHDAVSASPNLTGLATGVHW